MKITKKNRYHRPSLWQRAWEFITGILRFRVQWKRLRRLGESPNYLYLKDRNRWRSVPLDERYPVRHEEPSRPAAPLTNAAEPDIPARPVQAALSEEQRTVEEPAPPPPHPDNVEAVGPTDNAEAHPADPAIMEQVPAEGPAVAAAVQRKVHGIPDERRDQMSLPFE